MADIGLMGEVLSSIRTELLATLKGVGVRSDRDNLQEAGRFSQYHPANHLVGGNTIFSDKSKGQHLICQFGSHKQSLVERSILYGHFYLRVISNSSLRNLSYNIS